MTSKANFVNVSSQAQPKHGMVGPVVIYGTYTGDAGETVNLLDADGKAIVLDHDGEVIAAITNTDVRAAAGSRGEILIGGTSLLSATIGPASDNGSLCALDYSARQYSAGDALTVAITTNSISGNYILFCRPR